MAILAAYGRSIFTLFCFLIKQWYQDALSHL